MNTAYTPVITYNAPPFGFEERPNPPDFNVCPEDPYAATENLKNEIKHLTRIANNGESIIMKNDREFFSYSTSHQTDYIVLIIVIIIAMYLLFKTI